MCAAGNPPVTTQTVMRPWVVGLQSNYRESDGASLGCSLHFSCRARTARSPHACPEGATPLRSFTHLDAFRQSFSRGSTRPEPLKRHPNLRKRRLVRRVTAGPLPLTTLPPSTGRAKPERVSSASINSIRLSCVFGQCFYACELPVPRAPCCACSHLLPSLHA